MPTKKEKKLSYEEALERLEAIVSQLEDGELSLEESLKLFKEGMELNKFCAGLLTKAQGEVKKVIEESAEEYTLEDFVEEEE